MSIMLPDDVAWVLNLLGFMWPEADEDKLRASAQAWRDFGGELARVNQEARAAATLVTVNNAGDSIDAFERYWHGVGGSGGDFDRAREGADHMALALEGMADFVEGVKIAVIAQLGILATEIIADQLAAPETLGLSEGAAAAEIIVTRGIVRRIIQEGIHRVGQEIVRNLKGRVMELFRRIMATALRRAVAGAVVGAGGDLARQELEINVFHTRTHVDLGELGRVTTSAAILSAALPSSRKGVERNGYRFTLDHKGRTVKVEGGLVLNPKQGRNLAAQREAGGKDRLTSDEGGHVVARVLNGPLDALNHVAQNGNLNRGRYRVLESKWQKALDQGQSVYVVVKLKYPGDSLRPSEFHINYKIEGKPMGYAHFVNRPGGQ